MTGKTVRRGWRAIGLTAVGFSVGAGALGVFRTAIAEPIRAPLLPAPVSAPRDEQPTWTKKADAKDAKAVPASNPTSVTPTASPAPGVPPLPPVTKTPAGVAIPPSPPAVPALSAPTGLALPPVAMSDAKAMPDTESKGPVDVRFLRFPEAATGGSTAAQKTEAVTPQIPQPARVAAKPTATVVAPPAQPEKPATPVTSPRPTPPDSNLRPKEPAITLKSDGREPAAALPTKPTTAQPASLSKPTPSTVLPLSKPSSAPLSGDLGFPKLSGSGSTPVVVPRGGGLVGADVPTTPTGDAPVTTLPIRKTVMSAVLGAALATTPARADDPKQMPMTEKKAEAPAAITLESLKKDVDALRDDIKALQTFRKDLEDTVFGKKDGGTGVDSGLLTKLDSFERTIKRLDERLAAVDTGAARSSTALRADTGGAPANTGATGTVLNAAHVRIVNEYPVEMSMIVNRKAYRVGAGETKTVDVPPGSYTYELLHAGAQPVTSTIKDNETVTLRIR